MPAHFPFCIGALVITGPVSSAGVAWRHSDGPHRSLPQSLEHAHRAGPAQLHATGAVVPLLRYRFSRGQSPWFAEAGIGLSVMNPVYQSAHKQFSTHFNFVDVLGLGRSFGEGQRHEMGLRLTHISNGGIKHPNPGETWFSCVTR